MTNWCRGFNIVGFPTYTDIHYPSCEMCHAVLIKNPNEASQLMCPLCGFVPEEEQVQKLEDDKNKPELTAKISPVNKGPLLIQSKTSNGRRNKKLYDELGNEINQQDSDIMKDTERGRIVKYYKETVYDTGLNDQKPQKVNVTAQIL